MSGLKNQFSLSCAALNPCAHAKSQLPAGNSLSLTAKILNVCGLMFIASFTAMTQDYTFTTIAGNAGFGSADGIGGGARFYAPTSLAFDRAGNLFVTDGNNQTVRELTLSGTNWVVTTIAGSADLTGSADGANGVARFNSPGGVTTDSDGNVIITDAGNNTVRKLTHAGANWVVTTIAGLAETPGTADGTNSVARFDYPLGVVAAGNSNLLVADLSNFTLRKAALSGTNWIVTTIAGQAGIPGTDDGTNTSILFNGPIGLARDDDGNIYVADSSGPTIRKLTPEGTNWVSRTIAGLGNSHGSKDGTNNDARFSDLTGIAVDASGNVFVADDLNNNVRKLTPDGTNWIVTTIAGKAGTSGYKDGTNNNSRFLQPFGLAVDTNGAVFVGDQGNNVIRKITPEGTNWITTTIAGLVGGSGGANGTNATAQFNSPHLAAADAAGNVYVADTQNYDIRKLTKVGSDWVVTTIAGIAGFSGHSDGTNNDSQFLFPYGLALDAHTNLFVADSFNSTVRKITPDGTNWITTTIAGAYGVNGTNDGINTGAHFNLVFGIATDTNGNVYVADAGNHNIRKLMPDGPNWVVTTIAGQADVPGDTDGTNTHALFRDPTGLAADNDGNLFVADDENQTIREMTPSGTNWITRTIAGLSQTSGGDDGTNRDARFNLPFGVAVSTDGSLIVADSGNNTIRKITRDGTNWITTTIGGMAGVFGVADGVGDAARFAGPQGVAVDSVGRLFIFSFATVVLGEPSTAVAQLPALHILPSGNQVLLSWPDWASNFDLEATSPLKPGAIWTNLPGATLLGTNYLFTNRTAGSSEFFRLHREATE